jgi:hypothetical protein
MKHYLRLHVVIELAGDTFPDGKAEDVLREKIRNLVFCNRETQTLIELGCNTYTTTEDEDEDGES